MTSCGSITDKSAENMSRLSNNNAGFPAYTFYMTTEENPDYAVYAMPLKFKRLSNIPHMCWKAVPTGDGYVYLQSYDGRSLRTIDFQSLHITNRQNQTQDIWKWKAELEASGEWMKLKNKAKDGWLMQAQTEASPRMVRDLSIFASGDHAFKFHKCASNF